MSTPDPFDEPEEFERHFDRLLEGMPKPKQLPPDLQKLFEDITTPVVVRKVTNSDLPLYMLGRFEALGSKVGGMGLVIEARDPGLDRKVAIKFWMQAGPEAQAALLAEAKTLAKLSHPNVVSVFETGTWGERVYFVMEWIEGVDGHEWMAAPRPWQDVVEVFVEAGLGLAAAHDAGIQHRDFKPANMLIGDDGRVVVADFGVADSLRAIESDEPLKIVGTPSYMAPERLRGGRGDARSDQFSFCVAMWKALHGQRPYAGDTREELLESIEAGVLRRGDGANHVPRWLEQVVRKGLAEHPDQRHRNMHELLQTLLDGPQGSETGDGDSTAVAQSGATARLLNAPGTAAHGSSVDVDELLDEIVTRLQSNAGPPKDGERSLELATDRPGPWRSQRLSVFLAIAMVASTVASGGVLAVVLLRLPPPVGSTPPRAAAEPLQFANVEDDPLKAILAHVTADDFGKATSLWDEQRQRLSLDDSLTIGRACLERAKELVPVDPEKAAAAAELAYQMAGVVVGQAYNEATKQAGNQLREDAFEFTRSRLPADVGAPGTSG